MPFRRYAGLLLVALVIALLEASGRPPGLDPAVLIPMAVLAGAAIDGLVGGSIAAMVGGLYLGVYYTGPAFAGTGTLARLLAGFAATGLAVLIPVALRDRVGFERRRSERQLAETGALVEFARRLGAEQPETVPGAVVSGALELIEADMAVLTVLDPPSGRHVVRAARGGSSSPVGIEVAPGVGITGQAIRDRRLIVATAPPPESVGAAGITRRLSGRRFAQTMAAVPAVQAGRVIATLTVGRADGTRFGPTERRLLEACGPIVALAVSGSLARRDADEGSPRDAVTGLYNKAYLEAALEQLIALRRREPPPSRPPLSIIMFDIDGFSGINDRHGRHVGDHVLRAVATVLRQRFRASDVVARVGPDSFCVVLNGATADLAAEAAAQIRRQVRELHLAGSTGEPVPILMSAGCATYTDGERPEVLIHAVEAALETARWAGPGAAVAL